MRPHLDDKILTAWNGLMISAFALGGAVLDEPRYAEAARRAAEFHRSRHLYDAGHRTSCCAAIARATAAIPGFLDDYALFAQGLLDLYEAQFDIAHLEAGRAADREAARSCSKTASSGGFFGSAAATASLVMRVKEDYDGAEPSGNSVAMMNLLRLAAHDRTAPLPRIRGTDAGRLRIAPGRGPRGPAPDAGGLRVLLGEPREIVLVGERGRRRYARAAARRCTPASCPTGSCCWWIPRKPGAALAAGIPAIAVHGQDWTAVPARTSAAITPASCRFPSRPIGRVDTIEDSPQTTRRSNGKTRSNDS